MSNLDKYQNEAVRARSKSVLVIAPPGAGKTTVILNRIKYLLEERKVKGIHVIVITFTKAAAENMKSRFKEMHKEGVIPFFGTFHGLFYKILLRNKDEIRLIESKDSYNIIRKVLSSYIEEVSDEKIKEVLNNISRKKVSSKDLEISMTYDIFNKCYEAYETFKNERGLLDFDDLQIKAVTLLKENPHILGYYRNLIKYILVDEFQDCDDLQIEFLKLLTEGEENSLFAVGDEDQCIYSFRGSKPEYMVSFDKTFKSAKKYYLHINYRSNKNIIESSKKVISFNKERNKKDIQWYKDKDGIILCKGVYDERIQGDEISEKIRDFYNKPSYRYKENIVLYRTNMEAMSVIDSFIRNKIPFTLLDKEYNFFNHFICKDLLSYLSLAVNPYDREAFINIINKPFRYVSKTSIAYIREYKYEKDTFDILIEKDDTPQFQRKKLDELKRDFNYIKKSSLSSGIQYIVTDMGYIDYLKTYTERFGGNIEDLEEIVEEFKMSASSFKTIFEFFEHVDEVGKKIEESKRNKTEDRVLLSTIHGVKGMEFKNVFLINCNEDTIPHSSSKEENIEEERRLFYVGITRAIDNLFLFVPKMRKGKFRDVSRFIEEGGFMEIVKVSHGLVKDSVVTHKAFGAGKVVDVNGDEVGILFHDGMKRKFSAKVLLDNGLISK